MNLPTLDPELLQAFVAVADQRSFTRAAATLFAVQHDLLVDMSLSTE